MIVGTKRSIAPYKEDERKVDGGIVAYVYAYICMRAYACRNYSHVTAH